MTMTARLLFVSLSLFCSLSAAQTCSPLNCDHGSCFEDVCQCEPLYTADDCSVPFVPCDDGDRTCFNGSVCVRNDDRDSVTGKYGFHCDCTEAFGVSAFAGLQCEMSATTSCEIDTEQSRFAFCTNEGTCRAMVRAGANHPGCRCPDDFEGQHCQYLKGTAPAQDLAKSNNGDGKMSAVAVTFIVLVSLVVVGLFGFVVWKRRGGINRKGEIVEVATNAHGDLQLRVHEASDLDGEVI